MKDCLKKVYFLIISVFLLHCSMNMEDKVLLDKEGNFHASFNSFTKPDSPNLLKEVDEVLKQP